MSDAHPTAETPEDQEPAAGGHDETHAPVADHADGAHGHDGHGHGDMGLGPIDWRMWGVGVLGVAIAAVITAAFVAATNFQFTA